MFCRPSRRTLDAGSCQLGEFSCQRQRHRTLLQGAQVRSLQPSQLTCRHANIIDRSPDMQNTAALHDNHSSLACCDTEVWKAVNMAHRSS